MIPAMLRDRRFIELLQMFDREIAERAWARGCPECGGVLHDPRYLRKPRGLPSELKSIDFFRKSLCCAQDCCRRRATPPSALFFGRPHSLHLIRDEFVWAASASPGAIPRHLRNLRDNLAHCILPHGDPNGPPREQ